MKTTNVKVYYKTNEGRVYKTILKNISLEKVEETFYRGYSNVEILKARPTVKTGFYHKKGRFLNHLVRV